MFYGENIVTGGNITIGGVVLMSRPARKDMKDSSFFHIMVQGINKENIFEDSKDKKRYLGFVNKNMADIMIIAYCIMDNHAHFLVKVKSIDELELWMKKANTGYAIYYNKKKDRVGYVFRERYKSQPIKNIKHFYLCVNYIHNNPVNAKICNKMEDYYFSSFSTLYDANQSRLYSKMSQLLKNDDITLDSDNLSEEFNFIDEKKESQEDLCDQIIKKYLKIKEIDIEELKWNKKELKRITEFLKIQNKMSYRVMEKCLGISREKLRKIIINTQ